MQTVRAATLADIAEITAIYAHWVRTGTATFELEPPSETEMRQRFEAISDGGYPYLVAESAGNVRGYAYANAYRPRPAYRFTVEDPTTFVSPFTGEIPFQATNELIYEYACHEGNYALANVLSGARNEEKRTGKQQ